jgi:hypothetical protein
MLAGLFFKKDEHFVGQLEGPAHSRLNMPEMNQVIIFALIVNRVTNHSILASH